MNKFNIGNKVISIWEPDKIGTIKSIDTMSHPEPKYTVVYPDGNEYANYGACFKLVVDVDDVLEKGEILEQDFFIEDGIETVVSVLKYNFHLYYVKEVEYEVVKFKEVTRDER